MASDSLSTENTAPSSESQTSNVASQASNAALTSDQAPLNCQAPTPPVSVVERGSVSELPSTEWGESEDWSIDVASCSEHYYRAGLPFGSAWVTVRATGETCRVWLGGETENPLYRGEPTQYCEFPLVNPCVEVVEVTHGAGGPAYIKSPGCITWPQSQNSTQAAP